MNSALIISQAEKEDLATILILQKECYVSEAELYNDFNIQPLTQTIESITNEFQNGTLFLKGIIDNKIIASVRGFTKDNITYIGKLVVDKNFQNKKIAQTLMNAIEQRLNDCSSYELFTGHKSEKNIYLYKKLGYKEYKRKSINENLILIFMNKIV